MFERTTREWAMSPTMETLMPPRRPRRSRMVKASRRAWVGCSCAPSPALMIEAGSRSASIFGAPGCLWRMTIMSGRMAMRFSAVSMRVSPFSTEEPLAEEFSVSAERRFSAISKETRGRVEASMKRLMTSWPRRAGTFLTGRSETSLKPSAVSRIREISSGLRGSMPSRSFVRSEEVWARIDLSPESWVLGPECINSGPRTQDPALRSFLHDQDFILAVRFRELDLDHLVRVGRHGLADDVGVDGELAVAAVDQHGQHDLARAAEVDQGVGRGAHGAAGVEDVVDQHHDLVVDRLGELGRLDHRLRGDGGEVVAVEGDVEDPEGGGRLLHLRDLRGHPLPHRHSAAADPDDEKVVDAAVLFDDFDGHAADGAVHPRAVEQSLFDVHAMRFLEIGGGRIACVRSQVTGNRSQVVVDPGGASSSDPNLSPVTCHP